VFGRTNRAFPPAWLSLAAPSSPPELPRLVSAALAARTVVDISAHPGLFGGFMRGSDGLLMGAGGNEIGDAPDEDTAANLIHAHLIQTLSAIGREWLDFYFLRVRRPLEEFQVTGALKALEWARDESHVKYVGLSAETDPLEVQRIWQFHDAFEAVLLPGEPGFAGLRGLAAERRVGIVTKPAAGIPLDSGPILHTVRSAEEVRSLCQEPVSAG